MSENKTVNQTMGRYNTNLVLVLSMCKKKMKIVIKSLHELTFKGFSVQSLVEWPVAPFTNMV